MRTPTLGRTTKTHHGFPIVHFKDRNGQECSLQASSLAEYEIPGTSAVWLGVGTVRMHLDRVQVSALIRHLQNWKERDTFASPKYPYGKPTKKTGT